MSSAISVYPTGRLGLLSRAVWWWCTGSLPLSVVTAHPSAFVHGEQQCCSVETRGYGTATYNNPLLAFFHLSAEPLRHHDAVWYCDMTRLCQIILSYLIMSRRCTGMKGLICNVCVLKHLKMTSTQSHIWFICVTLCYNSDESIILVDIKPFFNFFSILLWQTMSVVVIVTGIQLYFSPTVYLIFFSCHLWCRNLNIKNNLFVYVYADLGLCFPNIRVKAQNGSELFSSGHQWV